MDNPIISKVIEQMNDLPPDLQQQVLELVVALRQKHSQKSAANAWDVLESMIGSIDAPPDWSSEHDHYLYGTPKQAKTDEVLVKISSD